MDKTEYLYAFVEAANHAGGLQALNETPLQDVGTPVQPNFSDNFENLTVEGFWTQTRARWDEAVAPGSIMTADTPLNPQPAAMLTYEPVTYSNVEVSVEYVSGNPGCFIGYQGGASFSGYVADDDGLNLKLFRYTAGVPTLRTQIMSDGATMILRRVGTSVEIANQGGSSSVVDNTYPTGKIGLCSPFDDARFDNVSVTGTAV